jgi:hypothetical protein
MLRGSVMRVHQKWGFGMAPIKPGVQHRRDQAATEVLTVLEGTGSPDPSSADAISEVKGLFTRSYKQDQWDWFTVWTQLGRPGGRRCESISHDLGEIRRSALDRDPGLAESLRGLLGRAGALESLRSFLESRSGQQTVGPGIGYVYILSTRTSPQLLKIGYTERTVEQRIKEINSATGVAEPYGVRAVWTVQNAPEVERAVHDALAQYRVRPDREFFELPYGVAFRAIKEIVCESRREL